MNNIDNPHKRIVMLSCIVVLITIQIYTFYYIYNPTMAYGEFHVILLNNGIKYLFINNIRLYLYALLCFMLFILSITLIIKSNRMINLLGVIVGNIILFYAAGYFAKAYLLYPYVQYFLVEDHYSEYEYNELLIMDIALFPKLEDYACKNEVYYRDILEVIYNKRIYSDSGLFLIQKNIDCYKKYDPINKCIEKLWRKNARGEEYIDHMSLYCIYECDPNKARQMFPELINRATNTGHSGIRSVISCIKDHQNDFDKKDIQFYLSEIEKVVEENNPLDRDRIKYILEDMENLRTLEKSK